MFGKSMAGAGAHHGDHRHPHDPMDAVEWTAMLAAIAFVVVLIVALAFQIGRP
ncbi:MAG TPA: hypothetical protein VKV36_09245 [Acidimicrobiales bacterium]|nr:hypothetical protein [Acidimicrobiales bacterium]HLH47168.1 hypothetical protein [Acidimicrobiales bacterium]